MRKQMIIKTLALLLVFSLCMSILPSSVFAVSESETANDTAPTLEDFLAGNATAEDIYGVLDELTVPEIIGYEEAIEKNHIQRLYEDEGNDLNKIVFLNVDGSKTMYTFDFPVKYIDKNGRIQDITLEIADSTTQNSKFESAANPAVTTFSAQFTDGITLSSSDAEIRLVPVLSTVRNETATMSSNTILDNNPSSMVEAQRIGENTIEYRYDDVTTVEYSLTYTGFKEDIVVREYTGQTEYPFRLYTNGLSLEEIDGSFFLVDDYGDIQATIGDIIIFTADERNNAFGNIIPTTVVENEEYLLTIVVDADYLADPNTTYPIRIDPTVEIDYNDGTSVIEDITITTNTNYTGSHTSLYVGRRSTEGIARALMRFPGLDLTGLEGATVTSASVRMRDLMCEDTPLDISCHVFTGSVWDANSATWANVSPNSYVSTALSTNTLSWSIGDTFDPIHWYYFDITSAVQGWIDGNYTQNKGIIFKASSAVENGSTIANRTFGSFNRASYKPSLSVTYTPKGTQIISNGTYYLNNTYTGKYIQKTSSNTAAGASGLISSIGSTIRWEIQKVSNGYVIRSASDPTKYLAGASSTSSSTVSIVTVNESTLPTRCVWMISYASGGGCLIRNVQNNRYLYSSGGYLYTATSTGSAGTSTYDTYVWRIASTAYYGNSSSHDRRELQSGFSIGDLIVNISQTKTPSVNKNPSNAMWAASSDFTFAYYSGTSGIVSFNTYNGSATGQKSGIATYKATHKVTNRTYYFKVYVDRYTYELVHLFGFTNDAAVLIRDLYNRVDTVFSNESSGARAWKCARVLSEFYYDDTTYLGINKWNDVAGSVTENDNREQYFVNTLGYTNQEYSLLNEKLNYQHANARANGVIDFCHLQYSLAARLAYSLNYDSSLSNWGTGFFTGNVGYYTDEEISYFAGWLGDAVLTGESGNTTSFKNDDYMSDLDAENIYHIIQQGFSSAQAFSSYYTSLSNGSNRSVVFKTHISYDAVRDKVFTELIDAQIIYWMSYYSSEGNIVMVQYYNNLLNDEEYHWNTIKTQYYDTYNFLKSLNDSLSNIANY